MNKPLELIFKRSVEILKQDARCLGGWHFGSVSRHQEDEYSDVDPVFLIRDEDFNAFDSEIPNFFRKITENCILIWPEEFNSNSLKNYAVLIKGEKDSILQYDFTIMNQSQVEIPFCKIWYKGCDENSIIFDSNGDIISLLNSSVGVDCTQIDILHQISKYWLFCFATVKYYKRKDVFKLLNTMQELFHTHLNLLLTMYRKESWGGWPSLIKNNIPTEKQDYLLKYFCNNDISKIKENLIYVMEVFSKDIYLLCKFNEIEYNCYLEQIVKNYLIKNMVG